MKSFAAMYLLIGLAHGLGVVVGQREELAWWEPPAIVATTTTLWPFVMILDIRDGIRSREAVTAGAK